MKESDKDEIHVDDVNLADSCLAKVFENENVAVSSKSDLFANENLSQSTSKSHLVSEQHKDQTFRSCFKKSKNYPKIRFVISFKKTF